MNTIELTLAGIRFRVSYDKHSYEVFKIERYTPHVMSGWQSIHGDFRKHVEHYLPPTVLIRHEQEQNSA